MQPRDKHAGALSSANASSTALWRALGTLNHAKALQISGEYEYVEPNFRLETLATYAPNDPSYLPQRWHYEQINLPSAMDRILALSPTPTQRPIVAVIDTGIISNHPDLQAQIVGGYSFITTSTYGDSNTSSPDDPSTASYCQTTTCWHGSHVAGTIAAISDNSQYGAGVAKMAQLMPLRVFQPGAGATSYDVSQAILYAARLSNNSGTLPARKADVINMSLGGSGSCPALFTDVITQARAQNVIVVAAAGNSATAVGAPANCTGVISVGALDASKQPTYYSNYGANLSLSAPGGDSTKSTTGTGYPDSIYSTLGSWSGGTRIASFGPLTGTSMASPHVAGVMALMRYGQPGDHGRQYRHPAGPRSAHRRHRQHRARQHHRLWPDQRPQGRGPGFGTGLQRRQSRWHCGRLANLDQLRQHPQQCHADPVRHRHKQRDGEQHCQQ